MVELEGLEREVLKLRCFQNKISSLKSWVESIFSYYNTYKKFLNFLQAHEFYLVDFDILCQFSKVFQVCQEIQVTLALWELLLRVLKALQGYQDCEAERAPQEMLCLFSLVPQANLVSLGLWDGKVLADTMEVQGHLVGCNYYFKLKRLYL